MARGDNFKTFLDEKFSNPPWKNYPDKNIYSNDIDKIWSFYRNDMPDYKTSNRKRF